MKFSEGLKVSSFRRTDGALTQVAEKWERPLNVLGLAKDMTIVMQPPRGGMAPWIHIDWGEGEDEYVNLATVQSVVLKGNVRGKPLGGRPPEHKKDPEFKMFENTKE